jgi:hypothetical protein
METLSQEELHRLRRAAEQSWDDDTRHANLQGHPEKSVGQCRVTSQWLRNRLGGHVGLKGGHYFWVSPDKHYGLDLTGDNFYQPPKDLRYRGIRLDDEDEGWEPALHHTHWNPGPVIYNRMTHPLFKDARVIDAPEDERSKLFAQRAEEAYNNG